MQNETTDSPAKSKRRRRFGSIYSRKWGSGRRTWSANWFCKVTRKRLVRAFDTEKEAKDFLAELERRLITERYEVPPTIADVEQKEQAEAAAEKRREVPTLVAYAEDVIERRFDKVLAPGTMGIYRAALLAWKGYFGKRDGSAAVRLDQITPAMWLDYRAWRATARNSRYGKAKQVGTRTLNADQQALVRILNEAVLDGHLERNPLAGMRKLREARRPRRYLSEGEVRKLIRACSWRFRPLVVAAVYTGARKCELLRLRWSDVSFEQRKIAIFRSKTGSSDWLDLHPAVAEALTALRERHERRGRTVGENDAVFLSRRGTPFTNISKSWALAVEKAGLSGRPGLTPHALRHTFSTHYLSGGGAVTDLQQQLGHAELATTQIYASALSERRRAAVMALDFGATKAHAPAAAEDVA